MAIVFTAKDKDGARLAIKTLLPELWDDFSSIERFAIEVRAATTLRSKHVVEVRANGLLEVGVPFMVMEWLHGEDLSARLQRCGSLPVSECIGFCLQACKGVAAAHAKGIIHRDLKPANLFVTGHRNHPRCIKVLDFGVAKMLGSPSPAWDLAMMDAGILIGSPRYASPEQMISSHGVDARTDIWSLGVTLYELVTGRPPFVGNTLSELRRMILTECPVPIRDLLPSVSPKLQSLIERCLQKEPRCRYSSALDLSRDLDELRNGMVRRTGKTRRADDTLLSVERCTLRSRRMDAAMGTAS